MEARTDDQKMGWNATFAMAVGGMIGGGIFSVLGVVVDIAGSWAWASFVLGGCVAFLTARSYVRLAAVFGEGGGAFTFLSRMGHRSFAGSLSWLLIAGYVLTNAVYAFTFGHYVAGLVGAGGLVARLFAVGILAALAAVNLRGVGDASALEIVTVWGKLTVLGALAAVGLWRWAPDALSTSTSPTLGGVLAGSAGIFMAYEGFQLLTYDYEDIRDPDRTLPRAVLPAVVVVTGVYVAVALAAASLVGASALVAQRETALAVAGEEIAGLAGKVVVSIAAAFSAASAINATLFATARLSRRIAAEGELPGSFAHENRRGVPDRSVVVLGAAGMALALLGSLGGLVEAASITFLATFAGVNVMAATRLPDGRVLSVLGAAGAGAGVIVATVRLAAEQPASLLALGVLAIAAFVLRPWLLQHAGR